MPVECSIVVPLCNEERVLRALHLRLIAMLRRLAIPYEIIYVDDGSTDATPVIIRELHEEDSRAKGVFLSRNFGHQAALCAGLEAAKGQAVITIDGDLQDPPELIPELLARWREGYHIVYAKRRRRPEGIFKRAACFLFYRLLRRMSEVPIPLDTGDYALMDRRAVDQLNSLPERTRFIRGLRSWIGFKQCAVEYDRDGRLAGESKYPFSRLLRLGMDGVFAFSDTPLRAVTMAGAAVIGLALIGLVAGGVGSLGVPATKVPGLFWLAVGLVLLGGIQLVSLGILGEYVGRIYRETRSRPLYLVRDRVGFRTHLRAVPNVLEFLPTGPATRQERATAARLTHDFSEDLSPSEIGV